MSLTKKIKIGIVEDEALIAEHLSSLLESLNYEIHFIYDNARDALKHAHETDLLLVDIKIKGDMDGIDLVNHLTQKTPHIFISSNSDEDTVERAKQTNPSGFLVKPFRNKDVEIAVDIAIHNHITQSTFFTQRSLPPPAYFFVKEKNSWTKLFYQDVYFIQGADNYSVIYLKHEQLVITKSLKYFEETLPPAFIRVHKSFIVNTNHIDKVSDNLLHINNKHITIGNNFKKNLNRFLGL